MLHRDQHPGSMLAVNRTRADSLTVIPQEEILTVLLRGLQARYHVMNQHTVLVCRCFGGCKTNKAWRSAGRTREGDSCCEKRDLETLVEFNTHH